MKTLTCLLLACLLSTSLLQAKPKNVLFIISDDLRPELSIYGSQVKTPNMDRLAREGMLFERAYCNVPVCGASRASLLTGIRPGRHRFLGYSTWAEKDAPDALPLPGLFQQAGYTTIAYGKIFHHGKDHKGVWNRRDKPEALVSGSGSWRDYYNEENIKLDKETGTGPAYECHAGSGRYKDERLAKTTIETLRELKDSDKPFFFALGFVKPHLPFNAPKEFWDMYDREDIKIPETYMRDPSIPRYAYHNSGELRNYHGVPSDEILPEDYAKTLIHAYYAATSYVDAQLGRVLDALDELGMREDTIVVLCGDHGYNLGEHSLFCKHTNFHHALQVPLIIDAPGAPDGARTRALVEYVDLYPTLAELTGLEPPEGQLQGNSLTPLLKDPNAAWKDFVISKYYNGISIRTDRFLYTEWQRQEDGVAYGRMLFDLKEDPLEKHNLAEDPAYAETVRELSEKLRQNWGDNFEKKPPSTKS